MLAMLKLPAVPPLLQSVFGNTWPAVAAGVYALSMLYPAWHISYIGSLLYYFYYRGRAPTTPTHLFSPMVRRARCLKDVDIHMHKSNSTYFSDVDVSRNALLAHLTKHGFNRARRAGRLAFPRLGGVAAQFRREIPFGAVYEVRSRLLAWDDKWVYVVTHFVETGANGRVYATALSKMVYKRGRVTVAPEDALRESGLLPGEMKMEEVTGTGKKVVHGKCRDDEHPGAKFWTAERIEAERKRGMEVVQSMLEFDGLEGEVRDGSEEGLERIEGIF
ncbi:hypothetical protein EDC01DRAFT_101731 [Geopyxis carbonaria]|nr:hypothetical protein EDC01DRAFT_101731 [Geopyxis carbonaria]